MPETKKLTFLAGPAASGKTEHILSLLRENIRRGEPRKYTVLVPDQMTHLYETSILNAEGINGFFFTEVLSFKRFYDRLQDSCLLPSNRNMGEAEEFALLYRILNSGIKLEYYDRIRRHPGFARNLMDFFSGLKLEYITEKDLKTLLEGVSGDFRKKLSELLSVRTEYEAFLKKNFIADRFDYINGIISCLNPGFISERTFFLDGFYGFTLGEFEIVKKIIKYAPKTFISFTLDPSSGGNIMFSTIKGLMKKISVEAGQSGISSETKWFKGKQKIPDIAKGLFVIDSRFCGNDRREDSGFKGNDSIFPGDCLKIISFGDFFDEFEYITEEIKYLVSAKGYAYSDFAVIIRDLDESIDYIRSLMSYSGINYFLDATVPVKRERFAGFILSLLQVIVSGWDSDRVFSYLKSCFFRDYSDTVSRLEDLCFRFGLSRSRWKEKWRRIIFDENLDENGWIELDALKNTLIDPLIRLEEGLSYSCVSFQKAIALIEKFLDETGLKNKLSNGESSDFQIYESVFSMFREIDSLGIFEGEEFDARALLPLFSSIFEFQMISRPPQFLDGIIIADAFRSRIPHRKIVFLCRMNEGIFPKKHTPGKIFSLSDLKDAEFLTGKKLEDLEEKRIKEYYLFYIALTRATERIYVTSSGKEEGSGIFSSVFFNELVSAYPSCVLPAENPVFTSRRKLKKMYYEAVRSLRYNPAPKGEAVVYNAVFNFMPEIAPSSAFHINYTGLPETGDVSSGGRLSLNATRANSFLACPYKYFAAHMLEFSAIKRYGMENPEMGSFFHLVLKNITLELMSRKIVFYGIPAAEVKDIAENAVQQALENQRTDILKKSPYAEFYLRYIRAMLFSFIEDEKSVTAVPGTNYLFAEKLFTADEKLTGGGVIELSARVDRIDSSPGGIHIVDYKLSLAQSDNPYRKLVTENDVQLLFYYLVLEADKKIIPGRISIAVRRALLRRFFSLPEKKGEYGSGLGFCPGEGSALEGYDIKDVSAETDFLLGCLRKKVIERFSETMAKREFIPQPLMSTPQRKACSFCDFLSLCRYEGTPPPREAKWEK